MNKLLRANVRHVNAVCMVVAICALLSACSWRSPAVIRATSDTTAVRRSESSAEEWDQELRDELMRKTAVVVAVSDETYIESIEPNKITVQNSAGVGSAIPVSRDGYLVTAAHTLHDHERLVVAGMIGGGRLSYAPARVVWAAKGQYPDLAILHTELSPFEPFEIADIPSAGDANRRYRCSNMVKDR